MDRHTVSKKVVGDNIAFSCAASAVMAERLWVLQLSGNAKNKPTTLRP
jgi:hypothetical protein